MGNQRRQRQRAQCVLHARRQDHGLFRSDQSTASYRRRDRDRAGTRDLACAARAFARAGVAGDRRAQTAIGIGAALFGLGEGSASVANAGYEALIATRFSRTDEAEADRIGLELTARAGYDPRAGITLWQKMIAASQGGRPPEFLSSHPAEASRGQQIQSLLPAVMPLYETARRRG